MIAGGNWWRANEIVIRHLTRQTATRYRCRDRATDGFIVKVGARQTSTEASSLPW
jgi:hypothetical protein